MLQNRGLRTAVLESRPKGKEQKVVVGEAITEGSSVFMRHEIGLGDWLKKNAYRKFGFDFVIRPRDKMPERIEDCHELLLSLTPLEKEPASFAKLIPTYHVERTTMNAHVVEMARMKGAEFHFGASVEQVEFGEMNTVHFSESGEVKQLKCTWVIDCSGRRTVLGRQLGITHPAEGLNTAAVWNRFENVETNQDFWRTFRGVDRRRHTIHFTGPGFWIWWIHQRDNLTSVGVSWDRDQHNPDVKSDDHGFWEMMKQFPPVVDALKMARPLEPYQYYAHLPYRSEHWISSQRYALIGDAAWFTDALYSIGIETACRQLVNLAPIIIDSARGVAPCKKKLSMLNQEFRYCQDTVLELNRFKYKDGWKSPHVVMQTALYELGEIAELYHMQDAMSWKPEVLEKHYRLQWSSAKRQMNQRKFQESALMDAERDRDGKLLKKALLPGKRVLAVTWPLWKLPNARPYFFMLTRAWGFAERLAQRSRIFPDGLRWMAGTVELPALVDRLTPKVLKRAAGLETR
jgi:2-polyprenyl-6-methoxyphenol hydroxylase-like FAD-dependent oxidoreductase